ncbi:MAG: metallophosphoesterase [Gammaproteobacteria bacterium]|nr:metallophosphoesterase [Gammaproteobacteria bacterium]
MTPLNPKEKKSLLKVLRNAFSDMVECEVVDVKEAYRLPTKKVKVQIKEQPFQINLYPDGKPLHIYPEPTFDENDKQASSKSFILFDPERYYSGVSGFYRLNAGDKIILGGKDLEQRAFLNIPKELPARKLSIANDDGELVFKSLVNNPQSCIAPLLKDKKVNQLFNWRLNKLARIREIFGGPIEPLSNHAAFTLIREANRILAAEAHRPLNAQGEPGGLLHLPDDSPVIILGDLHAKPDNLLTVLSQNSYLEALEAKSAYLVIIGDAVHPEGEVALDEMESSMLIMDLILKLKLSFPSQFFYLRGNHDSFSQEIAKGGIPQGLLWEKELIEKRGDDYRSEMLRLYDLLPYLVYSSNFVSCHAAAPTTSITPEDIINIKQQPKLINELINNRLKRPNRPAGYAKGDVIRLRKSLGIRPDAPFIVGHTPLSNDETIWENVGDIQNHHIIYSSDTNQVGAMVQIGDTIYPFKFPVEQVMNKINSASDPF